MKINSGQIIRLLAARHSRDVFVPECKDGPTYGGPHLRLDAWAMRRSWANPCTWGYEIKLRRQDFLRDHKWPKYLPLCNQFCFVAPSGMIDPNELPAEVGLLVPSKNASRLYTKKRAATREAEADGLMLRYIVMCRARVTDAYDVDRIPNLGYWKNWLAERQERREIGRRVSLALAQKYQRDVREVQERQKTLEQQIQKLDEIARWLKANDLSIDSWNPRRELERQYEELQHTFPLQVRRQLETTHAELGRLIASLGG